MTKADEVKELMDKLPPDQLGLLKLSWALEEIKERYNLSVNMHSGDRRWYSLNSINFDETTPYSIEVFLTHDNEVRVRAVSLPVMASLSKLTLGDFSYPNPAWTRQFRIFKDMVGTLYDDYEQK